ncbi:hypothetical protein RFI_10565 [Reticulomyxa filosa]|uniref:Uncharacterized protein n=1 Tax=Reticulomyxa filosa TaxID=46433 RepID=X6NLI1_RETFI|nr:hypothetical protein RFI_10565 [Reticulomyxa filosa]|eukprot:ETO26574.1 hypothetical protein RFI_10565 [Reticulomyxa filosa]
MHRQSEALSLYDPMFVVPMHQVMWITCGTISGGIYFEEFNHATVTQWLCLLCGLLLNFFGLFQLMADSRQVKEVASFSLPSDLSFSSSSNINTVAFQNAPFSQAPTACTSTTTTTIANDGSSSISISIPICSGAAPVISRGQCFDKKPTAVPVSSPKANDHFASRGHKEHDDKVQTRDDFDLHFVFHHHHRHRAHQQKRQHEPVTNAGYMSVRMHESDPESDSLSSYSSDHLHTANPELLSAARIPSPFYHDTVITATTTAVTNQCLWGFVELRVTVDSN